MSKSQWVCEICKEDCWTPGRLIAHVAKYHPTKLMDWSIEPFGQDSTLNATKPEGDL